MRHKRKTTGTVLAIFGAVGLVTIGASAALAGNNGNNGNNHSYVWWELLAGQSPTVACQDGEWTNHGCVGANAFPQHYVATFNNKNSVPEDLTCGIWYQGDKYLASDVASLTADGTLVYQEDWGKSIEWRFVYGGDCPSPSPSPSVTPTPEPSVTPTTEPSPSPSASDSIILIDAPPALLCGVTTGIDSQNWEWFFDEAEGLIVYTTMDGIEFVGGLTVVSYPVTVCEPEPSPSPSVTPTPEPSVTPTPTPSPSPSVTPTTEPSPSPTTSVTTTNNPPAAKTDWSDHQSSSSLPWAVLFGTFIAVGLGLLTDRRGVASKK